MIINDFYNKKLAFHVRISSFGHNLTILAMDYSQPDITLQARSSSPPNIVGGLRKVFASDPGLNLQLFLSIPVIAGGIVLHLNTIQWVLILFVTLLFLVAGIFRRAALLQIKNSPTLSDFHESRIRCMGNAIVALTAGISMLTYLMIFVPKITQLL